MLGRKNVPGVALGITMMLLVVLTLVVSAFFQAYRSHFSLTRSSNSSEAALNACESVYQYVAFRLEHDRTWGSIPFEADSRTKDPASPLLTFESEIGTHRFSGKIDSLDATFEGTIYNNISGSPSSQVTGTADLGTAFCQVTCRSGESTKRVDFLMKVAPLFDSSVLSRAEIRIDAERLIMRSEDENRNFIRAEENIYVPDMLYGAKTKFLLPNGNPDNNGMLWTKKNIHTFTGGTEYMLESAEDFAQASASSHGKLVAGADSHFSVFDLDKEQLQIPDTHVEIPVQSGRWNFVRRPATVSYSANYADDDDISVATGTLQVWVDVLEHYAHPDDTVPARIYRGANRIEDLVDHIPEEVDSEDIEGTLVTESITTTAVDIPGYPSSSITLLSDGKLPFYGDSPSSHFTFNLANQTVTASHNAIVKVNGPFHLTSTTNPGAPSQTPPPVLDLGYEEDSSIVGGVSKTAIMAKGTISIKDGVTQGLGTLISTEGDVRIQPKNTDYVTIDTDLAGSGLLVFAGNDVVLENPNNAQNWNFKGLVYARGRVQMVGSEAEKVTFTGSVVALNDPATIDPDAPDLFRGIDFSKCGDVEFIYSSEMLDAYVQSMPGDRIQVETAFWRI